MAGSAIGEQQLNNVQSLSTARSVPEPNTGLLVLVAGVAMALAGQWQNRRWS